jgi:hypothetical protein
MLTVFSTAKPFQGQSAITQRNALRSWALIHPDVEVILFGDDEGAAETCRDLAIRHEPDILRNKNGTKYLNYIFDRASELSRHKILCYANCDIMLTSDFQRAMEVTTKTHSEFLMIGRRWDTKILENWDFGKTDWEQQLRSLALLKGQQNGPSWVDYFCFSRDLYYQKMPPFLIGRNGWDPWLIWFAHQRKVPLIDASSVVVAVHQHHDYVYLRQGVAALHANAEADYNWKLGTGKAWHYYTVDAASDRIHSGRLRPTRTAWFGPIKSRFSRGFFLLWFGLLNITRPIRQRLGLRGGAIADKN